ncbi:30S ribosomal protein S1 [Eubacteriales bacterium mix99]|jgi:4-hydroxy-3-methylbut-2-enyl diphosphate reductase|nr:30S ribosomal protein S1 [Clostridiales bacterium]
MDEKKDEIMEKNTAEADIGDEKKDGITENTAEAVDGEEKKDINPEESTAQSAGENKEETEGAEKPSDAAEPTEQEIGESVKKEPSAPKDATMESFDIVSLHPGQVVDGTVLTVTPDELIVNVGYKSDGIVTKDEIAFQDGKTVEESFHEGDKIKVEVLKVNDGEGNVVLSQKKIIKHKIWKEIEDAYQNKKEVTGVGKEVIKGGVLADIRGISAFVPASQLSVRYVADLSTFVGQDLRLRILETDKRRSRVVASQRVILEEEAAEQRNKVWDNIQEGQKITGEVKRLTNFGAFVDIGGVDGLIHISDLAWGHIRSPKEVVSEGQKVEVLVLSADRENNRISLGYKQTKPHPWDNIEEKYPVGQIFEGKIVRLASFGAFVELEPGVDGLVHISQISDKHVNKVEDVLKTGETVSVKVLNVKPRERRISLSIREAAEKKQEEAPRQKESPYVKEEMTVRMGDFFPKSKKTEDKE